MGIQGFTKFINDRAEDYFENYELRDCKLIIDGHSVSCQLYNWKHWQFDARSLNCYGGDYDKYACIVEKFFGMFKDVRVKPIVVFDGGFEQRKLPTIISRMQDKINIAEQLDPVFEVKQPNKVVFPLFLREAFKDILRKLDVEMVMCEYEGDTEIASIARSLDCPVLTFDSDYFLFGAQYIPFKTLDSKVTSVGNWRTGPYKCISCKIYKIEKFLESFPGLQLNTLHLLPVLLGNDYIDSHLFNPFLCSIGIANVSHQSKIKMVLGWLKSQTPEKAVQFILNSFSNKKERLFVLNKIEKIVASYCFIESQFFKQLNIKKHVVKDCKKIDFKCIREAIESTKSKIETSITKPQNYNVIVDPTEGPSENNLGKVSASECILQIQKQIGSTENGEMCIKSEKNSNKYTEKKRKGEKTIVSIKGTSREQAGSNLNNKDSNDNSLNTVIVTQCEENYDSKTSSKEKCRKDERELEKSTTDVKIEANGEENIENIARGNEDFNMSDISRFSFEETHLEKNNTSKNAISKQFIKNFTRALYPSSFMDILTQNIFYLIPQVEDYRKENSHKVSFDILRAIHKIVTNSQAMDFTIVGRGDGTKVERFPQEQYLEQVPSLEEIEELTLQERRDVWFKILNIETNFASVLEHFPTEWHTFLVSLKFIASKISFETSLIYSLVLCFIILNYIDQKIGYYRSPERYKNRFHSFMHNLPPNNDHVPFRVDKNCFYYFPTKDCIILLQKVLRHFKIDPKENSVTFDRHLVHQMAQIQSVLLHVKYLNSLLKYPYPNLIISQVFNSTFIYNLTRTFKERSAELETNYLNVFLKDCPSVLAGFKYVLSMLNKQIILCNQSF
ncbi:protein asteroid-like [Euwallacea fornicatus]|uniref:protein asteroid-like n=1 Tax=Euwallacea fornicatus TaxID=995702 RepID=UPI00338E10E5